MNRTTRHRRFPPWWATPEPLAFCVQSRHAGEAARVADLLAARGFEPVFVIVPPRR